MFYFLVLLGSLLIALGIFTRDIDIQENPYSPDYSRLENRIHDIEKLLFDDLLDHETLGQSDLVTTRQEDLSKHELILKYEKEGKTIEEICYLLDMHKGEVFLLKSLYKDI